MSVERLNGFQIGYDWLRVYTPEAETQQIGADHNRDGDNKPLARYIVYIWSIDRGISVLVGCGYKRSTNIRQL